MIRTIFIAGPTASGKTEYAIALAKAIDGEIVSADSMQLYKYMDIGSAKPTFEERSQIPHYLIDEIDPKSPFNVSDYQRLALKYIREIDSRGKIPVVCGGTGLYFNSLLYDMDFSAPEGDNAYREAIFKRFDGDGERLHAYLESLDPGAAKAIHPNNIKRCLRAVERLEKGEERIAAFADFNKPSKELDIIFFALDRERVQLYRRIDERVDKLFERGLADEVKHLMDMGFTKADIAMKGIGYKEVIEAFDSGLPPESAAELIKKNTRHYARRQLIWFRRYKDIYWISLEKDCFEENKLAEMLDIIKEVWND